MMTWRFALRGFGVLTALTVVGCGVDAGVTTPTDDAAAADVAAVVDVPADVTAVAPSQTLVLTAGGWTMQPKDEATRCVLQRLNNENEVWITRIRTKLSTGSHHMIIYRSDAPAEQLDPQKCTPFTETLAGGNVPLMITQVPTDQLQLPNGVAFKLGAHQMIRIEMHFIDYTKDPITPNGEVNFDTVDKSLVHDEADLLFYGNPDFSIPKGKSYSTPWKFLDVWPGTKIFALTGHTHGLGKSVDIAVSDGTITDTPSLIYPGDTPFSWSEPPLEQFNPPLEFAAGQGFQYRCTWLNDTATTVGFGESATKEMCFFWAYYYPSKGYRMCINDGKYAQYTGSDTTCCPDDALCDSIKAYLGKQ